MNPEQKTNTNVKQAVPFFSVSNMEESVRFYVDGLSFKMTRQWMVEDKLRWCWLQVGDAALMLQEFPKEGHDSWIPQGKVGEGVTIYFQCEDVLAIYREVTSRGIKARGLLSVTGCGSYPCWIQMVTRSNLRAPRIRRKKQNIQNCQPNPYSR